MHAAPALEYATFCNSARATSTCMMRASRPACWLPAGSGGSSWLYSDSSGRAARSSPSSAASVAATPPQRRSVRALASARAKRHASLSACQLTATDWKPSTSAPTSSSSTKAGCDSICSRAPCHISTKAAALRQKTSLSPVSSASRSALSCCGTSDSAPKCRRAGTKWPPESSAACFSRDEGLEYLLSAAAADTGSLGRTGGSSFASEIAAPPSSITGTSGPGLSQAALRAERRSGENTGR